MVDRKARDAMAELLRRYLAEEITAFEFDEGLDEARESPTHPSVPMRALSPYE